MVWIGMASFLVPAMVIWQCRMPLARMKGLKVSGKSLSTKVLRTMLGSTSSSGQDLGYVGAYMIVFNFNCRRKG